MRLQLFLLFACTCVIDFVSGQSSSGKKTDKINGEWKAYGHDAGGDRFSPLQQINTGNIKNLKPAWTYQTGELKTYEGTRTMEKAAFEATPLMIGQTLYFSTPTCRVIAIDAATGKEKWVYDPKVNLKKDYSEISSRGVSAWSGKNELRIFVATIDGRLIALDAATGKPISGFGAEGTVDLKEGIGKDLSVTSPPAIIGNRLIVGSSLGDNGRFNYPKGTVRAYDVLSGKLQWSWDPIPEDSTDKAWSTWKGTKAHQTGAANAWAPISADADRDLVFIPTSCPSPDYYGGLRAGDDRWANSVVALRPKTGALVWGFQLVHHDLWDYDTAAPPLITTLTLHGRKVPALLVGNKTGMIYVLDPDTGKPLVPVEERPVPPSTVPGELASPTQPFPVGMPALARQKLRPQDAWGPTPGDRDSCRRIIAEATGTGLFSPPSLKGSLEVPGAFGGINWSGFAWDATHERLIVASSNLPFKVQLIPADKFKAGDRGNFRAAVAAQLGAPYAIARAPLLGPSGLPCSPPPWGELIAFDPASDRIAWRRPLGSMRDVFHNSIQGTEGSVILGGPIVTATGLVFSGGTMDHRIHALSAATGEELWSADLPASAHAQPITYEAGGRQFVVIAAGGSAKVDQETLSDVVVAFALEPHQRSGRRTQR